ncbi:hypothetical protein CDAR_263821 [Caerostris darwini]|uniref:Uncharacterized protein n=1 Tax=Caerostris darwini TaxID=1538125 RepID=A0AAV4RBY1_9ARAC|nr:hypothetical protein CDAR_263821 [Caerostris darwini]
MDTLQPISYWLRVYIDGSRTLVIVSKLEPEFIVSCSQLTLVGALVSVYDVKDKNSVDKVSHLLSRLTVSKHITHHPFADLLQIRRLKRALRASEDELGYKYPRGVFPSPE